MAVSQEHVTTLQDTAKRLPELAEWKELCELPWDPESSIVGALRLHSGCKVVHIPSYLEGLWEAVQSKGTGRKDWVLDGSDKSFDALVLAAGSGLFQDSLLDKEELPIQLVRGQSVEMTLPSSTSCDQAMLCGKYISPLLQPNRILVGATHEFSEALPEDQVVSELRERTNDFASNLWDQGTIDRITLGYRVQSNRGKFGRMPIVGELGATTHHDKTWIFTGLSSRGLLYHGIFGEILASQILGMESEHHHPEMDWWQKKK